MGTEAAQLPDEIRILAALPFGVGLVRQRRLVYVNDALAKLMRATPEELLGTDAFGWLDPADLLLVSARQETRSRGGRAPPHYDVWLKRADGSRVQVELEPRNLNPDEVVICVRDLSENRSGAELLATLARLAANVQRARTVSRVLHEAVEGLRAIGFQSAVFEFQGEWAQSVCTGASSEVQTLIEGFTGQPLKAIRMPIAQLHRVRIALEERRAVFFDDFLPAMSRLLELVGKPLTRDGELRLTELGLTQLIIAPIWSADVPWGFLVLAGSRVHETDSAAIFLFANQIGSTIEIAHAIENLERQNMQLEAIRNMALVETGAPVQTVAEQLLAIVTPAMGSNASTVFIIDEERRELVLSATHGYRGELQQKYARVPLTQSTTGTTALGRVPRALSVEEWPEPGRTDMLAVGMMEHAIIPLVVGGRVAGALNLARIDRRRFSEQELAAAAMLGAELAAQVERARLQEEARSRADELSLMNEVGALISHHLELEQVFSTAMRHCTRIVNVPNSFLLLVDAEGRHLKTVVSNQDMGDLGEFTLPLTAPSAAGEAVRTRQPVAIDDAFIDPRASTALAARFQHRALLAVPLLSEGRALGALVLGDPRTTRRFTQFEIERAVAVANQLASAIANARLYEEQRRRVEHLKLLLEISQVITGSLDLDQILKSSAQGLAQMIDATDGFIWLLEHDEVRGVVASSSDLNKHFSKLRLGLSEPSAVAEAIRTCRPVLVEDATTSAKVSAALRERFRMKGVLAIPLLLRDVPIGAISIGDRRHTRRFTEDEVERTLLVSRQIAVAIENARLFEDLRRSYLDLSRAQQELVRRERLAALGELSAVVAHEVRNPLAVIFNSLSSLKRMIPESDDARMLLSIVGEEADRLNRMVSDLLDFARPNDAELRPSSLEKVIEGAIEAAARAIQAPNVNVVLERTPGLPLVPMDPQMIRQAVVNLLVNAIQAMPRGGSISVRTAVEARGTQKCVRLDIQDDGPGIPPELNDRVFQPFFTTRAAGTGLGLAVVKRIADAHHAEISVRSSPTGGSTFSLWLPCSQPEADRR